MTQSPPNYHVFSLTGGIGSGKSTVARYMREAGVPVVDADALAREVVEPDTPGLEAIARTFGPGVIDDAGQLDRKALGHIVFSSPQAREELENILHPLIHSAAHARFAELGRAGERLVCYDIPLLFETGQEARYRPVVVVHVPESTQLARVLSRDDLDEEEVARRIAAQIPLEHKAEQADHVIDNTGSLEETRLQTFAVVDKIRRRLLSEPGAS